MSGQHIDSSTRQTRGQTSADVDAMQESRGVRSERLAALRSQIPQRLPAAVSDQLQFCQRNIMNGYSYLVFALDGRVDADRLKEATRLLVDAEPLLGCRFVNHWRRAYWQRRDDIDDVDWLEIINTDDIQEELNRFAEARRDPCVDPVFRVLVFRQTERDAVAIEMSNVCTDAGGAIHLFKRLGHIYQQLESDPQYVPPLGRLDGRNYSAIAKSLGFRGRMQILKNAFQTGLRARTCAAWEIPKPAHGADEAFVLKETLSPERVRQLSRFGRKHGASVHLLLMTAAYRAIKGEFCPRQNEPLPIFMPLSLRAYFPGEFDDIATHFVGGTLFVGKGAADEPFTNTLAMFRQQFSERGKTYLGLVSPSLLIESLTPLRWLFHLLPYRIVQRLVRFRTGRMLKKGAPGLVVLNSVSVDASACQFGPFEVESIFIGGNLPRLSGVTGVIVMRLRDSVTISTGGFASCVPQDRLKSFLNRMLDDLSKLPAPVAADRSNRRSDKTDPASQ